MNGILFSECKILVVAAHPDDEVIGQGGTIHRLVRREGCEARALVLGEGMTARNHQRNPNAWREQLKKHKLNFKRATERIGYNSAKSHDLPDNRFDNVDLLDVIKIVEEEIRMYEPDIIFCHHPKDLNIDHRLSCEAVITATRPMPDGLTPSVLAFETLSSTEWQIPEQDFGFQPNFFVTLSHQDILAKQQALEEYDSEIRKYPHPRSVQGIDVLARYRGITIGSEFAEGFRILRCLVSE